MQVQERIISTDCRAVTLSDNSANVAAATVVSFVFILAVRIFANCFFYYYRGLHPYPQGSARVA